MLSTDAKRSYEKYPKKLTREQLVDEIKKASGRNYEGRSISTPQLQELAFEAGIPLSNRPMTLNEAAKTEDFREKVSDAMKSLGANNYAYYKDHVNDAAQAYNKDFNNPKSQNYFPLPDAPLEYDKKKVEKAQKQSKVDVRNEKLKELENQRRIDQAQAELAKRKSEKLDAFTRGKPYKPISGDESPYTGKPFDEEAGINDEVAGIMSGMEPSLGNKQSTLRPNPSRAGTSSADRMIQNVQNLVSKPDVLTQSIHKAVNTVPNHRSFIPTADKHYGNLTPPPSPDIPQELIERIKDYSPEPVPIPPEDKEDVIHKVTLPELPKMGGAGDVNFGSPERRAGMHLVFKEMMERFNNHPYESYPGEHTAPLSSMEKQAHEYTELNDPHRSAQIRGQHSRIKKGIEHIRQMPRSLDVAEPHLKEMTRSPQELYKKHMAGHTNAYVNSLMKEYDKNFNEKILPSINKHIVPGQKGQSGMQNRMKKELLKEHEENRQRMHDEIAFKKTEADLNRAQKYAEMHGNAAHEKANMASQDKHNESVANAALATQYNNENAQKRQYNQDIERQGSNRRAIRQNQNIAAYNEHHKKQGHVNQQLMHMGNFLNSQAMNDATYTAHSASLANPSLNTPNVMQSFGAGLPALAANMMPNQNKKRGGVIKTLKRAAGGSIMSDAVQNAVIDKEDPLSELRRLMNRQRAMDVLESSVGKRRYRSGGAVKKYNVGGLINPIEKGALEAKNYMGEKNLRDYSSELANPAKKPYGTSLMDAFMEGVAATHEPGKGNYLSRAAAGYTKGAQSRDKRSEDERQNKLNAYKLQYDLDTNDKKEAAGLRKESREERELLSKMGYQNAKLGLLKAKTEAKNTDIKLDKNDEKILADSTEFLKNSPALASNIAGLEKLEDKITTGTPSAQWKLTKHPYIQEKLGHGEQSDFEKYDIIGGELGAHMAKAFGGSHASNKLFEAFQKIKPNTSLKMKTNKGLRIKYKKSLDLLTRQSYYINEQKNNGISPSNALIQFRKDHADEFAAIENDADESDNGPSLTDLNSKAQQLQNKISQLEGNP